MPLVLDEAAGSQPSRVHAALRAAILEGRLAPGTRLPSSRALAEQLQVRRNAVVAAYEHLLSDGLVEARVGAGTFVAAQVPFGPTAPSSAPAPSLRPALAAFSLGRTHPDPALLQAFARAIRRRLAAADPAHFGYGDPRGSEELRVAIASHLAATRGIRCEAGCVLLTSGTQSALRLLAAVLLRPGDAAWMEDPGYPPARRSLEAAGARVVPVPVDGAGLNVAEGRRRAPRARLAYVTPSHQFPTGVAMTMARRLALLDWAGKADGWVLEDDYDSEFRYAGPPLTALAGMDGHGRTIYLGTFSKALLPGLRMGYAVLPAPLVERVVEARAAADPCPASLLEGAVVDLLSQGIFTAHVRRMRSRYRAARDLVAGTLLQASHHLLQVTIRDQGLHLVALLPEEWPPEAARDIRKAAGIEGRLLSDTQIVPTGPGGFVLGFSGHSIPDLRAAAERLGGSVVGYGRLLSNASEVIGSFPMLQG